MLFTHRTHGVNPVVVSGAGMPRTSVRGSLSIFNVSLDEGFAEGGDGGRSAFRPGEGIVGGGEGAWANQLPVLPAGAGHL